MSLDFPHHRVNTKYIYLIKSRKDEAQSLVKIVGTAVFLTAEFSVQEADKVTKDSNGLEKAMM